MTARRWLTNGWSGRAVEPLVAGGLHARPAGQPQALRRHVKMQIEQRLEQLGFVLPQPVKTPPGVEIPFTWIRVHGDRVYISGHGPLNPDGTPAGPFGRVGAEVSAEQGYTAARLATLSILSSLKGTLGDLDRIAAWLVVS